MRPLPTVRLVLIGMLATIPLTSCGGDNTFPRDEFVKQVTASGLTKPVANCIYDKIKSNKTIMTELERTGGPNQNISEKVSNELAPINARCLLAADDNKPDTTTTTKKK